MTAVSRPGLTSTPFVAPARAVLIACCQSTRIFGKELSLARAAHHVSSKARLDALRHAVRRLPSYSTHSLYTVPMLDGSSKTLELMYSLQRIRFSVQTRTRNTTARPLLLTETPTHCSWVPLDRSSAAANTPASSFPSAAPSSTVSASTHSHEREINASSGRVPHSLSCVVMNTNV